MTRLHTPLHSVRHGSEAICALPRGYPPTATQSLQALLPWRVPGCGHSMPHILTGNTNGGKSLFLSLLNAAFATAHQYPLWVLVCSGGDTVCGERGGCIRLNPPRYHSPQQPSPGVRRTLPATTTILHGHRACFGCPPCVGHARPLIMCVCHEPDSTCQQLQPDSVKAGVIEIGLTPQAIMTSVE